MSSHDTPPIESLRNSPAYLLVSKLIDLAIFTLCWPGQLLSVSRCRGIETGAPEAR